MSAGTTLTSSGAIYGRGARDLLETTHERGVTGARAVIETFYRAINAGNLQLLLDVWADDPHVQVDDPLGGVVDGRSGVAALHASLFQMHSLVWIQFDGIVEIASEEIVIFAGQERGVVVTADDVVPLRIRTTRCCGWIERIAAWRLVHNRSSIDDPELLDGYRRATERRTAEARAALPASPASRRRIAQPSSGSTRSGSFRSSANPVDPPVRAWPKRP